MQFIVGTSGYSYSGWKGSFYPPKLPQAQMLNFYSQRFASVELNNTFYRLPDIEVVASWMTQVPGRFRFAVKAPQTITHRKRLRNVEAETNRLLNTTGAMKRRQGPLLFQLPPNFKKDLARLQSFLELLAKRAPSVFEFRHESWFDDEVSACLRKYGCPLCVADTEDGPVARIVRTAPWGYLRLRRDTYTDTQLKGWIKKLRAEKWRTVYVYFKHDEVGVGPKLAARFLKLAGA